MAAVHCRNAHAEGRVKTKCDGTRAETRFGLSAKRTSPFISAGVSVQPTAGSRGVRISGQQLYRPCSDVQCKAAGYPLHLVFQRNGRVHLNRRVCQFSRLLAAEVCASAVVMLDRPCSDTVQDCWLPTPFASFPFTSPVLRRVPPDSVSTLLHAAESFLRS